MFKKGMDVVIIFPATQINGPQIYRGQVIRVSGAKEAPLVTVAPITGVFSGYLDFRGTTGKGLGTEAFLVKREFVDFCLKN